MGSLTLVVATNPVVGTRLLCVGHQRVLEHRIGTGVLVLAYSTPVHRVLVYWSTVLVTGSHFRLLCKSRNHKSPQVSTSLHTRTLSPRHKSPHGTFPQLNAMKGEALLVIGEMCSKLAYLHICQIIICVKFDEQAPLHSQALKIYYKCSGTGIASS